MMQQTLHLTDKEISNYINNQLDEYAKQFVELELELCEHCMERFIEAIDHSNLIVPIEDEQMAIQQVMSEVKQRQRPKKTYWIQRPFAQYAIAASITLILTVTGLFGSMTEQLSQYEHSNQSLEHRLQQDVYSPTSEKWLGKTTQWLEQLKTARFDQ